MNKPQIIEHEGRHNPSTGKTNIYYCIFLFPYWYSNGTWQEAKHGIDWRKVSKFKTKEKAQTIINRI